MCNDFNLRLNLCNIDPLATLNIWIFAAVFHKRSIWRTTHSTCDLFPGKDQALTVFWTNKKLSAVSTPPRAHVSLGVIVSLFT